MCGKPPRESGQRGGSGFHQPWPSAARLGWAAAAPLGALARQGGDKRMIACNDDEEIAE